MVKVYNRIQLKIFFDKNFDFEIEATYGLFTKHH